SRPIQTAETCGVPSELMVATWAKSLFSRRCFASSGIAAMGPPESSGSFGSNYLLLRSMAEDLEIQLFAAPADLEEWLEANAATSPGLWLQIAKKGAPAPSVTYAEALEVPPFFGRVPTPQRA